MADYRGGSQAVCRFVAETAPYPLRKEDTMPGLPGSWSSAAIVGVTTIPERIRHRANRKYRVAGSPFAAANVKGTRFVSLNVSGGVRNISFLRYCLRSSTGLSGTRYKGLPALCMWVDGVDEYGEGGVSKALRFMTCDQLGLTWSRDAPEVNWNAQFMGLAADSDTAHTLSVTALDALVRALGEPLTWYHTSSINAVDSTGASQELRDFVSGFSVTLRNNLQMLAGRPASAGIPYAPYGFRPGDVDVSAQVSLAADLGPALIDALLNSDEWGDLTVNTSNQGVTQDTTRGLQWKGFSTTFVNALLGDDVWGGGEPGGEIASSVPLSGDDLVITNLNA